MSSKALVSAILAAGIALAAAPAWSQTSFFAKKIAAAGGEASQSVLVRFGASREVGGVSVTTVPAVHSNGLAPAFLEGELASHLEDHGLTISLGPPTGYVLQFSNGLSVYLSGDTGITAEQGLVVRDHYGAKLAVMNIGDVFTTGPREAAAARIAAAQAALNCDQRTFTTFGRPSTMATTSTRSPSSMVSSVSAA